MAAADAFGIASKGSLMERILRERGEYVPQEVLEKFTEALQAICLEQGGSPSEAMLIKVRMGPKNGPEKYNMQMDIGNGVTRNLEPFHSQMSKALNGYFRDNGIEGLYEPMGAQEVSLRTNDLNQLFTAMNEGFIARFNPDYKVDFAGIMAKDKAEWEDREAERKALRRDSGENEGVGGLG